MKKLIATGYGLTVIAMLTLQSCDDGPIVPNNGANDTDTTWVTDSTDNGGGNNGGADPTDSTANDGGNNGGNIGDSTTWGGGDPSDTLGGN